MKPAAFDYVAPGSLEEVLARLALDPDEAKIIAGGQSLIPMMNFRLARPSVLVDIQHLTELVGEQRTESSRIIGARVTHAALEHGVGDDPLSTLLRSAARHIAHAPIRNRGTLGGSLAHADPTSEWCLVARLLDATLHIAGPSGGRQVAARDFFRTVFTTAIEPTEVLTGVELPILPGSHETGFAEFARRAGDFAIVAAATDIEIVDGSVSAARVCLGGVSDVPVRAFDAEALLVGTDWSSESARRAAIAAAGDAAAASVNPASDSNGATEYRRDLVKVMIERAIQSGAAP